MPSIPAHAAAIFCLVASFLSMPSAALADKPDKDDLILPGPNGVSFTFRPVYLKTQDSPLAGVRYIMGDPAGDFRAPPTAVVVGGSFASRDPRGTWLYYLGQCEVTEAQYDAVMGPPQGKTARKDSHLPVTGISFPDAQRFTDTLTRWLYANAMDKLPSSGTFPAYVRLPTEAEWEYAARGGSAVNSLTFDAGNPYGDNAEMAEYEWFSGPTSSHNKVQPVGKLKPNPLGLHDMLGNVSEMTQGLYYIEYYQGRCGGFVARGGHFLTSEDKLHTALHTEEPMYLGSNKKGMNPNAKATMGFRLALAAPLLTDKAAIKRIEEAWETHRSSDEGATMPAALSVSAVSVQEAVPAQDALGRLQRISQALQKAGLGEALKNDLAATEASLRSMAQIRKQADEDSAKVWVKIAGERGMYLVANLRGMAVTREAPTENLRRRAEQFAFNVDVGLENYGEIMAELSKLPQDAVLKGFGVYEEQLGSKAAEEAKTKGPDAEARVHDIKGQIAWLKVTRKHYEKQAREKRSDVAAWRIDYSADPKE